MEWLIFREELKQPPPGRGGKKYSSVEARCRACVMREGDEPPCLPEATLRSHEKARGRPCPYVALEAENSFAAELVRFALSEPLRPLAERFFAATADGMPLEEQRAVLIRVANALGNGEVLDALYPWRKEQRERKGH